MRSTERSLRVALLAGAITIGAARAASPAPAATAAGPARTAISKASRGPAVRPGHEASASPGPKLRAEEEDDARLERYRKWVRDWRARRDIHKKARLKRLRYRLQRALRGGAITADIRNEIERHARVMAQLNRIKELAVGHSDLHSVGRVEALARQENARHERWLRELQGKQARGAKGTDAGDDS